MRNVRKDVIAKLNMGFEDSREHARKHGYPMPKGYRYRTPKAEHHIYEEGNTRYYNTVMYDGTICHTEIEKRGI